LRVLKWAAAALVVLGLGYGVGHASRGGADSGLRDSLVSAVKQQVQQDFRADWQAVLTGAPESLNTDFRRQLRADLQQWSARTVAASQTESQKLLLGFAETYNANRQQDQEAMLTLFDRAEQDHQAQHLSLRRALETVAVVADDKFQRTENQLGELASYAEAKLISDKTN
jgi:hypothetical protein